jgi:FeS assembly SUF system protein
VTEVERLAVEAQVVHALQTCYDPEIPVNIYDLGLIYGHTVDADGKVLIKMTLTSPNCPVAGSLPPEIESKLKAIDGVEEAKVEVVWDPPWDQNKMSDAAKLQLGLL